MKKEEEWVEEEAPPLVGSGLSVGDDGTRAREVCSHAWTHCEVLPPLPLVTVARPGKLSSQVQSCRVVNTDFSVISVECRGNRIKLPLLDFSLLFLLFPYRGFGHHTGCISIWYICLASGERNDLTRCLRD